MVVGDGMADRPLRGLNGKTPLEVAGKPSLNWVAETGVCGIMDPIAPGIPPGSDTATLSLLGYDAFEVYTGRGALEALGFGVDLLPQDVAFRCNFATVDESLRVVDRRAGRIETDEASKIAGDFREINLEQHPDIQVIFKNTVQHRAILLLRGAHLSNMVSDSDPLKAGEPVLKARPLNDTPEARKTAEVVNEITGYFHEFLKGHPINEKRRKGGLPPANIILCRGAGKLPDVTLIPLQYGVRAAAITAMPLVMGVCKVAGMRLLSVPGATGTYNTDVMAKASAAIQALQSCDLVFVHVKATDIASHDGETQKKIEMIEKIDGMVGHILKNVNLDEILIVVTADHTTSSLTREHEGDPVPVAIAGHGVRTDEVREFGERACARGGLGRIRGTDLMPIIMNLMGKAKKFGA
ncbi:MAG: 2,3-bisphosphoglycerate-independent phosphoglycerate mutase [Candidatus Bathyarchaeota archaeon BA1]|nr:MAG: 2,3-bisphosphoglycerate-independent phosphoglycerate mutase [Candidatus Bathyarchaeota archaeon BA1]